MRRWIAPAVLGVAVVVRLAAISPWLIYSDLSLDYPFPGADDLDWISNALALGGADVRYTGRPPVFPLVLLGLHRLGILVWAPVLQQALLAGLAAATYLLARQRASRGVAAVTAAWLAFGHVVAQLALGVAADLLAATLLTLATGLWLAGRDRNRPAWVLAAAAVAGVSAATQPAALMWLIAAGAVTLLDSARPRWPWLAAALALFATPLALWRAAGPPGSGTDSLVLYERLLAWNAANPPFYAVAILALAGIPGVLLLMRGGAAAARRSRHDAAARFALAYAAVLALFFGGAYSFAAARFLLYGAPALALLAASGLAAYERHGVRFAVMSALLVAGAAWPAPAGVPDAAVLWPMPRVSLWHDGSAPRLLKATTAPWRDTALARAVAARRAATPMPTLHQGSLRGVDGVVYLSGTGEPAPQRYSRQLKLGNVLLRRVRVVPASLYPPAWWGGGRFRRLGAVGSTPVYRGSWPGGPEFAVASEDPATLTALGSPGSTPQPAAVGRRQWAMARRVASLASEPDGLLLVLGDPDRDGDWLRVLAVVVRTTSLIVPVAADRSELVGLARAAGCGDRQRVGEVDACRMRILRWPVRVIVAPSLRDAVLGAARTP